MGKWSCRCGQILDDHYYPDKNHYRVFSDDDWEKIEIDDEGKIHVIEGISVQTFDAYVCPNCGGLMIFGDDDRYTFYERLYDYKSDFGKVCKDIQ